jgi:hypothetical protein
MAFILAKRKNGRVVTNAALLAPLHEGRKKNLSARFGKNDLNFDRKGIIARVSLKTHT